MLKFRNDDDLYRVLSNRIHCLRLHIHVLSNFLYVYVASKSECPCKKKKEDKLPDHITQRNESTYTIQDV